MRMFNYRRGEWNSPLVLVAVSAVVLAVLALLLWRPWESRGIAGNRKLVFQCAAGTTKPIDEIIKKYKEEYGVEVQVAYNGTGALLSAIRATGGKGDLYLAADEYHMQKAREEGLVAEVLPLAYFHPVLIVKTTTQQKLREAGKAVSSLKDLLRSDLKVVFASESAAVGKLTKKVLSKPKVGIWPVIENQLKGGSARVSQVGTVNKVAEAVHLQENTVGVVWRAVARQHTGLDIIDVPEFEDVKEKIQVGILAGAKGEQATAALQFARYLTARDKGLKIFAEHNFDPVSDGDLWSVRPKIHLAAGAMLKPGIDETVKAFAEREGVNIDTSYNGCGLLVAQMRAAKAGNPSGGSGFPDAYFSCDVSYLRKVDQWFDAAVSVSKNDMVMIVKKGNPLNIRSLQDLTRKDVKTIGLGHPENSALGKLTYNLLDNLGLAKKLYANDPRVSTQDAGHALVNQMRVGGLDVAVVYRSNAKANPENVQKYMDIVDIDIPEALAEQPFAVAKDSPHRYLMKRLLRAIVARQTADRFRTLGFHWVYDGE